MTKPKGSKINFSKRWGITREWDRINRQSQSGIPLDSRIYKLFSAAIPFFTTDDGEEAPAARFLHPEFEAWELVEDAYGDWLRLFREIEFEEAGSETLGRRQRWEQLNLLQVLFDREGIFFEEDIPLAQISFQEMNQE